MKLQTESYNALGILLPEEELEIASVFHCDFTNPESGEQIVFGLWIQQEANIVEPRYLTQKQHTKLFKQETKSL